MAPDAQGRRCLSRIDSLEMHVQSLVQLSFCIRLGVKKYPLKRMQHACFRQRRDDYASTIQTVLQPFQSNHYSNPFGGGTVRFPKGQYHECHLRHQSVQSVLHEFPIPLRGLKIVPIYLASNLPNSSFSFIESVR